MCHPINSFETYWRGSVRVGTRDEATMYQQNCVQPDSTTATCMHLESRG